MKKIISLTIIFLVFAFCASSQDQSPKEKAVRLAQNEFSKTKHKKKEKNGIVVEVHTVIVSIPVIQDDLSFYEGNYVDQDLNYKIEIRKDAQNKLFATLTTNDSVKTVLKNTWIRDAYFTSTKTNAGGLEEPWEGVFINRNENGTTDFGLGIKLSKPIVVAGGLEITRIFLKKVSP
jgi:hypothetical protein